MEVRVREVGSNESPVFKVDGGRFAHASATLKLKHEQDYQLSVKIEPKHAITQNTMQVVLGEGDEETQSLELA